MDDKKNITLINFLVNCPFNTIFSKTVDASSYMKIREKVFELLYSFVEEIGDNNVVQVFTYNESNFKLIGKNLDILNFVKC